MSTIYSFKTKEKPIPHKVLREPEQCYNNSVDDPLDPEQQRRKDRERLLKFCLMDDTFMSAVYNKNIEAAELTLRILLMRNDLTVLSVKSQYAVHDLQKRSIRLDIRARDTAGRIYNIEVQRKNQGASPKRARYYSSLLDADISLPGEDFDDLAEIYVIFITENDVMGRGLQIYHIDRVIRETGEVFADASHIVYVNAQITDDSPLGRLMHDFWCTSADEMYYGVLARGVRHYKEEEEGIATMCKAMEDMRNEVAQAAEKATRMQLALDMIADGTVSHDKIAMFTRLSLAEVEALADKQPA